MMLSNTGVCPYKNNCEYLRDIRKIERALLLQRRELYVISSRSNITDYDGQLELYKKWMKDIAHVKDRCFLYHGRCLRFWRFKRTSDEINDYPIVNVNVGNCTY